MGLQLEGKRALLTGGSRGIGKALALGLAHEGVDVALPGEPLAGRARQAAHRPRAGLCWRHCPPDTAP